MKRLLISIILILTASSIFAQAPDTIWSALYGDRDPWFGYDQLYGACATYDGGFAMNGNSTTAGDTIKGDQWVVKINANGDTLWTKPFGDFDRRDYGRDIIETYDHNLVILGHGRVANTTEDYRIRLFKADSLGNTIWDKNYVSPNGFNTEKIVETSDKGFAIVGHTDDDDIFLFRADSLGDSLWSYTYGGTESEEAYDLCQTDDNGFMLVGFTTSYGAGEYDAYIIRTDANGDTLWTKTVGTTGYEALYGICRAHDGNYVMVGFKTNLNDDTYLIKMQDNGDTLWTASIGQISANDVGYHVSPTPDGCYLIAGRYYNVSHYDNDMYMEKVDANGNTLWSYAHENDMHDDARDAIQTDNGNCYLFGTRGASTSGEYRDYWVVAFDVSLGLDDEINLTLPDKYKLATNFPNPFNPTTTIEYSLPMKSQVILEIYNINGQKTTTLINTVQSAGTHQVLWDGTDSAGNKVATGIYFYRLQTEQYVFSKKMVLLK